MKTIEEKLELIDNILSEDFVSTREHSIPLTDEMKIVMQRITRRKNLLVGEFIVEKFRILGSDYIDEKNENSPIKSVVLISESTMAPSLIINFKDETAIRFKIEKTKLVELNQLFDDITNQIKNKLDEKA